MTSELCSQLGKALAVCRGQGASSRPRPGGRSWPGFGAWQARGPRLVPCLFSVKLVDKAFCLCGLAPCIRGVELHVPVSPAGWSGVGGVGVLVKCPAGRDRSAKGVAVEERPASARTFYLVQN